MHIFMHKIEVAVRGRENTVDAERSQKRVIEEDVRGVNEGMRNHVSPTEHQQQCLLDCTFPEHDLATAEPIALTILLYSPHSILVQC